MPGGKVPHSGRPSHAGNNPFPPSASIVAYLRDSGHEDQELSVDQQEQVIRAWCSERGYVLSRVFCDAARPGSTTIGRIAFLDMVAHFRADGCPDAGILVWKFNRFARDIDDAQYYKADLRRRGYKIHSLNDSVPDGLDGRFFEAAIDWMNARYLEDLSVDVRRGLYYIVQQGGIPGIPPRGFLREALPLGNHRDGRPRIVHRWVPDPALTEAVRTAFQMRAAGSSYTAIANATHLYANKNSWGHFFANRLYTGELRYGDLVIPGYCEALVTEELFNAVQAVNQRNIEKGKKMDASTTVNHPRRARSVYLLSGLLRCARCGGAMNGETMVKTGRATLRYYGCSTHRRNGSCDAQLIPQPAARRDGHDRAARAHPVHRQPHRPAIPRAGDHRRAHRRAASPARPARRRSARPQAQTNQHIRRDRRSRSQPNAPGPAQPRSSAKKQKPWQKSPG